MSAPSLVAIILMIITIAFLAGIWLAIDAGRRAGVMRVGLIMMTAAAFGFVAILVVVAG